MGCFDRRNQFYKVVHYCFRHLLCPGEFPVNVFSLQWMYDKSKFIHLIASFLYTYSWVPVLPAKSMTLGANLIFLNNLTYSSCRNCLSFTPERATRTASMTFVPNDLPFSSGVDVINNLTPFCSNSFILSAVTV